MWKLVNLVPAGPPKPHIGPPDPPDGPGRPKMAQITIIQSSGDSLWQKINFGGGQFFSRFFHSDRPFYSSSFVVFKFLLHILKNSHSYVGFTFSNRLQQPQVKTENMQEIYIENIPFISLKLWPCSVRELIWWFDNETVEKYIWEIFFFFSGIWRCWKNMFGLAGPLYCAAVVSTKIYRINRSIDLF